MARILGIHSEPLPHFLEAAEILEAFTTWIAPESPDRRRLLEACARSGVERRQSLLSLDEILAGGDFTVRNAHYAAAMRRHGVRAVAAVLEAGAWDPGDFHTIVSVSCTGVMIPSVEVDLQAVLGFSPGIRRLPLTELGRVGGAAALTLAADLVDGTGALPAARRPPAGSGLALILAAEFPSLNFQPGALTAANIIASAIFGDAVTALVVGPEEARGQAAAGGEGPSVVGARSCVIPDTADRLGYDLGAAGFLIVLRPELPELLRQFVPGLVGELLGSLGWSRGDVAHWIIHPGGEKVLRAVGEGLGLPPAALLDSRAVLAERGNTSSTGVFLVLERAAARARRGDLGILVGLGPGVTAVAVALVW